MNGNVDRLTRIESKVDDLVGVVAKLVANEQRMDMLEKRIDKRELENALLENNFMSLGTRLTVLETTREISVNGQWATLKTILLTALVSSFMALVFSLLFPK